MKSKAMFQKLIQHCFIHWIPLLQHNTYAIETKTKKYYMKANKCIVQLSNSTELSFNFQVVKPKAQKGTCS